MLDVTTDGRVGSQTPRMSDDPRVVRAFVQAAAVGARRVVGGVVGAVVALTFAACDDDGLEAESLPELVREAVDLGLPGVIIVVDSPDPARAFAGAAGSADRANGVAMTVDAGFRIASNSKTFVSLALAGLHAGGTLDLDRPLGELLPPGAGQGIANVDRATGRQALLHTSGIPEYMEDDRFWQAVERGRDTPWTIGEVLEYARSGRPTFDPGNGWDYSNTNYLLAGLMLEHATGESWAVAVRNGVLDPLGLSQTFVENGEPPRLSIVDGYAEGRRSLRGVDTGNGLPDGGLVSTARELASFVRVVGGGSPAPASLQAAIPMLLQETVSAGGGERYGLGLVELPTPCGRAIGHGGAIDGYLSEMFYVPQFDVAVVVFANASDGAIEDLFGDVVERALELACGR